jgi:hypothetical protein
VGAAISRRYSPAHTGEAKMNIARKLVLLALAAVVATAFAASTASAQTIEIVRESNNAHCPIVQTSDNGGCLIRGVGEVALVGHIPQFGIEVTASDCNVTFEGRIDEDGEGYIYGATYSGDGAHNCTRVPCGLPWRIHGEELGGSQERLEVEFCADPDNPAVPDADDNRCLTSIPFSDVGDHAYRFRFDDLGGVNHLSIECELNSGIVNLAVDANHPAITIIHTP